MNFTKDEWMKTAAGLRHAAGDMRAQISTIFSPTMVPGGDGDRYRETMKQQAEEWDHLAERITAEELL